MAWWAYSTGRDSDRHAGHRRRASPFLTHSSLVTHGGLHPSLKDAEAQRRPVTCSTAEAGPSGLSASRARVLIPPPHPMLGCITLGLPAGN